MMKLSHFLRSRLIRSAVCEKLCSGEINNSLTKFWMRGISSQTGISFARPDTNVNAGNQSARIYADYTIYKGKAALSVSPTMPKFTKAGPSGLKVDRKGVVFLSFSPAIGERKYDWERKQVFALNETEIGSLISLAPGKSCEFFHDPSMKTSNAGQVRKSLSVTPLSADDTGYFFNLSVVNGLTKTNERFSVPVTKAEFAVIRTACSYILPYIMGWDQYPLQLPGRSGNVNPVKQSEIRLSADDEWDR